MLCRMEDLTPKNMTCQSPGHNVHELFEHGEEKGRKKAGGDASCDETGRHYFVTKHWLSAQICSEQHCLNFMVLLVLLSRR